MPSILTRRSVVMDARRRSSGPARGSWRSARSSVLTASASPRATHRPSGHRTTASVGNGIVTRTSRPTRRTSTSAVARGKTLVAATDAGELWRSTDATTWRSTGVTGATDGIGPILSVRPHGRFVAVAIPPRSVRSIWSNTVWTSPDGRAWTRHDESGTADRPVGLLPGALLGRKWLTLGPMTVSSPDDAAPAAFTSAYGVRWTRIPDTNLPERRELPAGEQSSTDSGVGDSVRSTEHLRGALVVDP